MMNYFLRHSISTDIYLVVLRPHLVLLMMCTQYFPWRPRVEAYDGHVTYTLNEEGLVAVQAQTWSISPAEALRQTFTPTWGGRTEVLME